MRCATKANQSNPTFVHAHFCHLKTRLALRRLDAQSPAPYQCPSQGPPHQVDQGWLRSNETHDDRSTPLMNITPVHRHQHTVSSARKLHSRVASSCDNFFERPLGAALREVSQVIVVRRQVQQPLAPNLCHRADELPMTYSNRTSQQSHISTPQGHNAPQLRRQAFSNHHPNLSEDQTREGLCTLERQSMIGPPSYYGLKDGTEFPKGHTPMLQRHGATKGQG